MNLNEISQLVSTLLADSSNNFYTSAERLQAINSACSYINSEERILRNTVNIPITVLDNGRIPLPVDFISLAKGVAWEDSRGQRTSLSVMFPIQLQATNNTTWDTDSGTPQYYVMEGSHIFLSPAPTESGHVILSYVAAPNKLLNPGDVPFYGDVRAQAYHDLIAFYAAWQLTLKDRDFEAAQQFMGYFQARRVDLRENMRHTGDIAMQPVWADTYSTA